VLAEDANKASYSVAANVMAGGDWAGDLVALAVIISGFGALNGWTMICAEMPLAAAKDGLFPKLFGRISKRGVPAAGIIASSALATVAMVVSYAGASGATVFNTLVLMSGITAAVPYAFSALAKLKWRREGGVGDLIIAVLALFFSILFIWYSRNSGDEWFVVWGPFLMAGGAGLIGIPVYLSIRRGIKETGRTP
jgi:APA family basic amino acid/polyamine antiporter